MGTKQATLVLTLLEVEVLVINHHGLPVLVLGTQVVDTEAPLGGAALEGTLVQGDEEEHSHLRLPLGVI